MDKQERPITECEGVIDFLAIPAVSFAPLETQIRLGKVTLEGEVKEPDNESN